MMKKMMMMMIVHDMQFRAFRTIEAVQNECKGAKLCRAVSVLQLSNRGMFSAGLTSTYQQF